MSGASPGFALAIVGAGRRGGQVAMSCCPGRAGPVLLPNSGQRFLERDVATIARWGAQALVTLLDERELGRLRLAGLPTLLSAAGVAWHHVPMHAQSDPDERFEQAWARFAPGLRTVLLHGGKLAIHCRDGMSRTGVVTARLLVEIGCPTQDALNRVRAARPGCVSHPAQERYLRAQAPVIHAEDDAEFDLFPDERLAAAGWSPNPNVVQLAPSRARAGKHRQP